MDIDYSNQFKRKNNFFENLFNKKSKIDNLFSSSNNLFQTNNIETKVNNLESRINNIENYLQNNKKNNIIHYGITCNYCNEKNIKGIRYKCGHCINYNVCQNCEPKLDKIHDCNHLFVRIHNPNLAYLVGN